MLTTNLNPFALESQKIRKMMFLRTLMCRFSEAFRGILGNPTHNYLASVHKRMQLIRSEALLLLNIKVLSWAETPPDELPLFERHGPLISYQTIV